MLTRPIFRWLIVVTLVVAFVGGLFAISPPHTQAQVGTWTVKVFNNKDLVAPPIWTGLSSSPISYTWGSGAPVINVGGVMTPTGAAVDNFSVEFAASVLFTAGTYRFTVQVDDGARLYIDGFLLINAWTAGGGLRTVQADYAFPADGTHNIVVQMFDQVGDATIIASWAIAVGPLPTPTTFVGTPWTAQFYSNADFTGSPVYTASYPASGLNLQWGEGSPGAGVPANDFSARITRTVNVPSEMPEGTYRFYAGADDAFRFTVDTTVIFNYINGNTGGQTFTADVYLAPGPHNLIVEYREFSVTAAMFLTWTPGYGQNPVLNPDKTTGSPITPGGTPGAGTPGAGTPGGTPAQTGVIATVNVNVLNVRSGPSSTASIITTINKGTSYPVIGRSADSAWAQITVSGQPGWAMAQYLTFSGDFNTVPVVGGTAPPPPPTVASGKGLTLGNLRIRSAPFSYTPQVGLVPWGTELPVLGKDYGRTWYQINYNGTVGWVYAPWVRLIEGTFDALPYTDGSQPPFDPPPPTSGVIAQAYGNVRIRSGPGLQFPKVARVVWGMQVQVLGRSTNRLWYKVKYGDIVGWSFANWYQLVQGDINSVPVTDQ